MSTWTLVAWAATCFILGFTVVYGGLILIQLWQGQTDEDDPFAEDGSDEEGWPR